LRFGNCFTPVLLIPVGVCFIAATGNFFCVILSEERESWWKAELCIYSSSHKFARQQNNYYYYIASKPFKKPYGSPQIITTTIIVNAANDVKQK
jgi:hypothetical protein